VAKGDCYDKAIELLARRPHFREELASKLLRRRFPHDEIDDAIARVDREGHLDDHRNALNLVSGPFRRKGFGPRRMRVDLERRGVACETVSLVLDEVFPDRESEIAAARATVERGRFSQGVDRAKVGRHLERKGYSAGVILQLLEELEIH
jgi:regulatory protein